MINFSDITKAVENQLTKAPTTNQYRIQRGSRLNNDPSYTPWVGIYRGRIEYEPRTLGRGARNWKDIIEIRLVVQATDIETGDKAEEELEKAIKDVLDAMETDRTIGGTVNVINGYTIDNYSFAETESETLSFQQAEITITAEARS